MSLYCVDSTSQYIHLGIDFFSQFNSENFTNCLFPSELRILIPDLEDFSIVHLLTCDGMKLDLFY